MVAEEDLATLQMMATRMAGHWRVCDDLLECGTSGAFHLLLDGDDGPTCPVAASLDVLDEDRERLVYLAAAANLAPLLAAEVQVLRARLGACG